MFCPGGGGERCAEIEGARPRTRDEDDDEHDSLADMGMHAKTRLNSSTCQRLFRGLEAQGRKEPRKCYTELSFGPARQGARSGTDPQGR
jgi:hypothetical protein